MNRNLRLLGGGMLVVTALLLVGAVLAIDLAPRVRPGADVDASALRRLQQLLRPHDPRRARPGALYRMEIGPTDLSLLTDHAARAVGGAAQVQLGTHQLALQVSLPLRRMPVALWLNIDAEADDGPGLPRLRQLRVGQLPVPDALTPWLLPKALRWVEGGAGAAAPLYELVQQVTLQPERLQLVYRWRDDVGARVLARLLPQGQPARLAAYHARLAALTREAAPVIELPALLAPLMALAAQRSADEDAAGAEHRAVLQVLALYLTGRSVASWLPQADPWPPAARRTVVLAGREDFSLHFIVSAALAAEAGGALADAFGLAKEVDDARTGSGFSFTDIAVNRAGRRFGELAIAAPFRLQQALAAGPPASALLPGVGDLPELMPERDFAARFGGVGAPAYERLLADIDRRIAALPLYR